MSLLASRSKGNRAGEARRLFEIVTASEPDAARPADRDPGSEDRHPATNVTASAEMRIMIQAASSSGEGLALGRFFGGGVDGGVSGMVSHSR